MAHGPRPRRQLPVALPRHLAPNRWLCIGQPGPCSGIDCLRLPTPGHLCVRLRHLAIAGSDSNPLHGGYPSRFGAGGKINASGLTCSGIGSICQFLGAAKRSVPGGIGTCHQEIRSEDPLGLHGRQATHGGNLLARVVSGMNPPRIESVPLEYRQWN